MHWIGEIAGFDGKAWILISGNKVKSHFGISGVEDVVQIFSDIELDPVPVWNVRLVQPLIGKERAVARLSRKS